MSKYVLRRLLILIPVLAGISLVLFTILALAPGDPFEELATNPNVPPEVRMNLRAKFGLDDPVAVRYVRWFVSMMRGDWGFSFVSRVNVDTLILQRLPTTLFVLGSALLLGDPHRAAHRHDVGSAPVLALRPDRDDARLHRLLAADLLHRPPLHPVLLDLARLAAVHLPGRHQRDRLALVLGARRARRSCRSRCSASSRAPPLTRFMRSAVLDVIRLDYVNTARAKGLSENVDRRQARGAQRADPGGHAARAAGPHRLRGAIITEQIFRVPGIGSLLISSILANDTPVIMAITFVLSCLVVLFEPGGRHPLRLARSTDHLPVTGRALPSDA